MTTGARTFALGFVGLLLGVVLGAGCGGDDPAKSAPATSGGAGGEPAQVGGSGPAAGSPAAGAHDGGSAGATSNVVDGCEAPTGAGTDVPSSITADETWTADGSPYRVSSTTYLTATLTIEPCTVVQLDGSAGILVGNDPAAGAIVAHGDETQSDNGDTVLRGIRFERLTDDQAWGSLAVDPSGSLDLSWVTLTGGGSAESAQNGGGTILAYGADPEGAPSPNVKVHDVHIVGSETYGVNLQSRAAFTPDSDALSIETSGTQSTYPLYLEAGVAFSLPTHLRLDGNERDEVLVHPFARVQNDTLPARGVPLVIDTQLYVATPIDEPGMAKLTIEAGTELKFDGASSELRFGADAEHPATLVAVGTAEAPIWMHSADSGAAPAHWLGLYFSHIKSGVNRLEHAVIEDAGAFSGAKGFGCGPADNDASILVLSDTAVEPFIRDCEIKNPGGETQMVLGWSDSPDQSKEAQAFVDTNTFAKAPACRVSLPRAADGPPCPGDAAPDCL